MRRQYHGILVVCCATYPLMVKVGDLLAENEVFQQGRASFSGFEAFLILDWTANIRAEVSLAIIDLKFGHMVTRAVVTSGC